MNKDISTRVGGSEIFVPGLALFKKHRVAVTAGEYDHEGNDGKITTRMWPMERIDEYTRLIPKVECLGLIAELAASLVVAHYDQAKKLTETILGRYAKRDLYNTKTFIFEMTRVFAEAPADLGQKACDQLRDRKFLPNVGDVTEILKPMVDERTRALGQARRQMTEHERREANPKPQPPTPEHRKAMAEKLKGLGKKLGAGEKEGSKPKAEPKKPNPVQFGAKGMSPEDARKYWNEKLGVEPGLKRESA